ncbi:AAA family ATPase [Sphaerisporangium viridialbum]|uniref:AAA family ATPase n=1 Tax=Sphaerisporangium viridialbum TaxID=46189 RepID=UPI003C709F86
MAIFDIRLLGEVSILVDGAPRKLLPQTAKALAMLVSARNPIPQNNLAAALGQGPDWPVPDVAPPLSRLRQALAGSGLDIPPAKWSHAYELVEREQGHLAATLDAARFERRLREGRELYDQGDLTGAMAALRAAAAEWRGAPFASLAAGWSLPWVCETYRAKLSEQRADLVRLVARIALQQGRYEDAGFLAESVVGEGQEDTTAVWLLRFLTTLREDGGAAARRVVGRRRPHSPGDEAVRRADDLLALHEHGFDVRAPLGAGGEPEEQGGPPVLVGRRRELLELSGLIDRLSGGDAAALAVCGVGGIGKTRLLRETARMAARTRVRMVTVMCQELDGLQPWRELAGALWGHLRRDLSAPADPISTQERDTLSKLMSAGVLGDSAVRPGHERDPRELTFLLTSLLRRAAGDGLLVAFDNAHLLSPYAEELLQHVRRGLGPAPVGFVLATRAEAAHWKEAMDTVTVSPLTMDEVGQWLGQVWGREPTPDETKEAAHVTDGLPLELCDLSEHGEPRPSGARAGTGPAFSWLAAAAITALGLDIDTALVARMLDLSPGEADRNQALAAAGNAIRGHDRVCFPHDRSREGVLDDLKRDPALARDLHRRAFEALSERMTTAGWGDPALPVRIAQHARAAGPGIPQERAAAACLDAARAEQRGFGVESAVAWAHAGLGLRCDPATRAGLLITLGDALSDGGDMDEAGRRYLSAYETARGLPRLAAAAAVRLARRWSAPGQVDQQLTHLLQDGIAGLGDDSDEEAVALRLQLQAHLAKKRTMAVGQSGPGPDGPAAAVRLARATLLELPEDGEALVRCEVLDECRWALFDHAHPGELLDIAARLHDAGIRAGSAYFQSEAMVALAVDQLRLGMLSEALGTVDNHRRHVARNPRVLGPWLQSTLDTVMDLWDGEFERAEERLMGESRRMVDELAAGQAVPVETLAQTWMGQYYWLLHERGRMGELFGSGLARQIEQHGYFPIWRAAHVLALCETGQHDEAADRLAAIVRETSGLAALPPHGWTVPTLAVLAEACALIGEAGVEGAGLDAHVPLLRARLSAYPEEIVLAGWPTALLGPTARFRGLLAMTAGDAAGALRCYEEAARMVSAAPPQMARIQLDRAKALRLLDPSDPAGEATRLLHRSLRLADRLGMARVAAEARSILAEG